MSRKRHRYRSKDIIRFISKDLNKYFDLLNSESKCHFKKVLLILVLYGILLNINAISYIENRLFFDIFLDDVNSFEISTKGNFYIQVKNETISIEKQKLLKFAYISIKKNYEIQTEDQINNNNFISDSINVNKWHKGFFKIEKKPVKVSVMNFKNRYVADDYARKLRLKKYKIIQDSGKLKVLNYQNLEFDLPIMILSDSPITYAGTTYNGYIKVIDSKSGSIKVLNTIEMEEYVAGVIPYEIGLEAPYEALKAQAVAARSQTIYKILGNRHSAEGFDLCNGTHCQVYKGLTKQNENTYRAAIETSGEVLIYNNQVIDAVFHSCCGGGTEDAKDAWGGSLPYLKPVRDYRTEVSDASEERPYCSQGGRYVGWYQKAYEWQFTISKAKIAESLGIGDFKDISIISRGNSGRITKMQITGSKGSETLRKESQIRSLFNSAKSSNFRLTDKGDYYLVNGNGMGHGVGLCQIGAIVQAHLGYNYLDILSFYYKDTQISNEWILEEYIETGE